MNDAGYARWANTEWWTEGYERLWLGRSVKSEDDTPAASTESQPSNETRSPTEIQKSVVYLTADATDELTELKVDETYIIGGLCDHNRYKVCSCSSMSLRYLCFHFDFDYSILIARSSQEQCLKKANSQPHQVRTARLPIGTYLAALPTRKVLTVNQVRAYNYLVSSLKCALL